MSEIGIISQKYKNTTKLFQKINRAVIVLKKNFYDEGSIATKNVIDAKSLLANVLANILMQLEDSLTDIVFDGEAHCRETAELLALSS